MNTPIPGGDAETEDLSDDFEDEPTQVTKLLEDVCQENRRARQSMAHAVRNAQRARGKTDSVRNLRAVVQSVPPPPAAGADGG